MDNIFHFEETEKFGLRKGIVFYFDDWIEPKTISVLEKTIEEFLLINHAEFTKSRHKRLSKHKKYSRRMAKSLSSGI